MNGGTKLTIYGHGFAPSVDQLCLIGGLAVPARIYTSTHLECITPSTQPGDALVTTSNIGFEVHANAPTKHFFSFHTPFHVTSLEPCKGPINGGTKVLVSLESLTANSSILCRFNTTISKGINWTPSVILCEAPPSDPGYVTLELSANLGSDWSSDGVVFEYQVAQLRDVRPRHGPVSGATLIRVDGVNIMSPACLPKGAAGESRAGLLCVFEGSGIPAVSVPATKQTASSVLCLTPAVPAARAIGPTVFNVMVQFYNASFRGGLSFNFLPEVTISSLSPSIGPTSGGTRVEVHGSYFDAEANAVCRFLTASTNASISTVNVVTANWRSSNLMDCISPSSIVQVAFVELSWNGQNFTSSRAAFEYYSPAMVTRVHPGHVAIEGGTRIEIHGDGFLRQSAQAGLLRCAFDGLDRIMVPATFWSTHRIDCIMPPVVIAPASGGFAFVEVTNNGVDFTESGKQLTVVAQHLTSLQPAQGPIEGGTTVIVHGSFSTGAHKCHFGAVAAPATLEDISALRCVSPGLSNTSDATTITLRVSLNDVTTPHGLHYLYMMAPKLHDLYPLGGPLYGGTIITISGHSFSAASIFCRFYNRIASPSAALTIARWQSDTKVECVAPHFSSGLALLEVSSNGQQFSDSKLGFRFEQPVSLASLYPTRGPVDGGTIVTVRATYLRAFVLGVYPSQLACRFNNTDVVALISHENDEATCIAPAQMHGSVTVQMTSNRQVISSSHLLFEFVQLRLFGATPSWGPVTGGTAVLITGLNIPIGQVQCIFGLSSYSVAASTDASTSVLCVAPPVSTSDAVQLSLTCDGAVCGNAISFFYYDVPTLLDFRPTRGPVDGGTIVTITGRRLADTGHVVCRFGKSTVRALWLDSITYVCSTPIVRHPGALEFQLSLNGQQFSQVGTQSEFIFDQTPHLLLVVPSKGPIGGGTTIQMFGAHLAPAGSDPRLLSCLFESASAALVRATKVTDDHVRCITPPQANGYSAVYITSNGVDFSHSVPFEFLTSTLRPTPSPNTSPMGGQTIVGVHGSGLTPSLQHCSFHADRTYNVTAHFESPQLVHCMVPPVLMKGAVGISIAEGDNPIAGATIIFQSPLNLVAITPARGPQYGGTIVAVTVGEVAISGKFAAATGSERAFCRFGHSLVPALYRRCAPCTHYMMQ